MAIDEPAHRLLPNGHAWTFPPRGLPRGVRLIGALFGFAPLLVVLILAINLGPIGGKVVSGFAPSAIGSWGLGVLIGVVGVVVVWRVSRFALAAAFGRTEVRLRRGRVESVELIGPLRWTRRVGADEIIGLDAHASHMEINGSRVESGPFAEIGERGAVSARREGNKDWLVLAAYPAQTCRTFAAMFAGELGVPADLDAKPKRAAGSVSEALRAADAEAEFPGPDIVEQPASSKARVEVRQTPSGEERTITLPALGVAKGSKGMLAFSLIWLTFCTVGFGVFGGVFATGAGPTGTMALVTGVLFGTLFIGIGVWILVYAICLGRRSAIIDIVGDAVLVTRRGVFGSHIDQWLSSEIKSVRVGPSGTTVNNVPVLELQIVRTREDGSTTKTGLFSERDNDELAWLASELRAALVVHEVARAD